MAGAKRTNEDLTVTMAGVRAVYRLQSREFEAAIEAMITSLDPTARELVTKRRDPTRPWSRSLAALAVEEPTGWAMALSLAVEMLSIAGRLSRARPLTRAAAAQNRHDAKSVRRLWRDRNNKTAKLRREMMVLATTREVFDVMGSKGPNMSAELLAVMRAWRNRLGAVASDDKNGKDIDKRIQTYLATRGFHVSTSSIKKVRLELLPSKTPRSKKTKRRN